MRAEIKGPVDYSEMAVNFSSSDRMDIYDVGPSCSEGDLAERRGLNRVWCFVAGRGLIKMVIPLLSRCCWEEIRRVGFPCTAPFSVMGFLWTEEAMAAHDALRGLCICVFNEISSCD